MANISIIARLINGTHKNIDLSTNTLVVGTIKVGGGSGTDLTKTILDNLISLQSGGDAGSLHVHDARYYTKAQTDSAIAAAVGSATPAAEDVSFDNSGTDISATDVQGALVELDSEVQTALSEASSASSAAAAAQSTASSAASAAANAQFTADSAQADATQALADAAAAQATADAAIPATEKGANNGVATLDSGGKIPVSQLPNSVMEFKGNWDASTNTPSLEDGTGNAGDVYRVNVAGTQDLGSGDQVFAVGDWVVYNGTIWQQSNNSNIVMSVNGQTGVVVLDTDDIAEGTALYFTEARAKAAAVVNSLSGSETDQAPSVAAVNAALAAVTPGADSIDGSMILLENNEALRAKNADTSVREIVKLDDDDVLQLKGKSFKLTGDVTPAVQAYAGFEFVGQNGSELPQDGQSFSFNIDGGGTYTFTFKDSPVDPTDIQISHSSGTDPRQEVKDTRDNAFAVISSFGAGEYVATKEGDIIVITIDPAFAVGAASNDIMHTPSSLNVDYLSKYHWSGFGQIARGGADAIYGATDLSGGEVKNMGAPTSNTSGARKAEVEAERIRAEAAEADVQANVDAEVTRATGAEAALQTSINNEVTRASNAEQGLQDNIDAEATARAAGDADTLSDANAYTDSKTTSLKVTRVAGESLAANTTFAVRLAFTSEFGGRVYKADNDASSASNYNAIGLTVPGGAVSAGDSVDVILHGSHTLGSSDTPFDSADIGKEVFLSTSGGFVLGSDLTNAANEAAYFIGIVEATNKIFVGNMHLRGIA